MTTDSKSLALVPRSVSEAESFAITLSKSQLVPEAFRNKPADIFMAIAYGMEIGLPPVSALRAVAVIKGKPTLYADAIVGLVLASGKAKYFTCVVSDGVQATYETHRVGSPQPVRKSFSLDDAKAAGLMSGDGMYKKYPRQMLEARAKAHLARDVFPDLLHGIYSAEEASEFTEDARPVASVTQFRAPETIIDVVEDPLVTRLQDAATLDELQMLVPELSRIADPSAKSDLRKIYAARKKELASAEPPPRTDAEIPAEAVG